MVGHPHLSVTRTIGHSNDSTTLSFFPRRRCRREVLSYLLSGLPILAVAPLTPPPRSPLLATLLHPDVNYPGKVLAFPRNGSKISPIADFFARKIRIAGVKSSVFNMCSWFLGFLLGIDLSDFAAEGSYGRVRGEKTTPSRGVGPFWSPFCFILLILHLLIEWLDLGFFYCEKCKCWWLWRYLRKLVWYLADFGIVISQWIFKPLFFNHFICIVAQTIALLWLARA